MWNITSDDVRHAKDRLAIRRAAIEARYAEEKGALDGEFAMIETLERAAFEFARLHQGEDAEPASEITPSDELGSSDKEIVGRDILKPGSRWRLHLGNHSLDTEGASSSVPPAPM